MMISLYFSLFKHFLYFKKFLIIEFTFFLIFNIYMISLFLKKQQQQDGTNINNTKLAFIL